MNLTSNIIFARQEASTAMAVDSFRSTMVTVAGIQRVQTTTPDSAHTRNSQVASLTSTDTADGGRISLVIGGLAIARSHVCPMWSYRSDDSFQH